MFSIPNIYFHNFSSWMKQSNDDEARLTILHITDVYTLENFPSLKTMLKMIRKNRRPGDKVISILTGDFLSPYLLSYLDNGKGMMYSIMETPIDYLTWGNHESDIEHKIVCQHVKDYYDKGGIWINTNMQTHEAMKFQRPYDIIEIKSESGEIIKKIGLIGILTNDPRLYINSPPEGPFGGAFIEDPWNTISKYKKILENEHNCDLVIPLEHLYVPQNKRTCHLFNFPLILSGHDHHPISNVYNGTLLLKPGMNADYVNVTEIIWTKKDKEPLIRYNFIKTNDFEPDVDLKNTIDKAYRILSPLRETVLINIPEVFHNLSSKNSKVKVTTMGRLICSLIKLSLNNNIYNNVNIDVVILMGYNIKGNFDYGKEHRFTLEMLNKEIKKSENIGVIDIPGSVLADFIRSSNSKNSLLSYFQYDLDLLENNGKIISINGTPIDFTKSYRVATKLSDLFNLKFKLFHDYILYKGSIIPENNDRINIHDILMLFFARNSLKILWNENTNSNIDIKRNTCYKYIIDFINYIYSIFYIFQ